MTHAVPKTTVDRPGPPLLEIRDVTVSFDGFKAIDGLNFSVKDQELRVIIGPNGAGKTTFLDVISQKTRSHGSALAASFKPLGCI